MNLEQLYKKYNYVGISKLNALAKKEGVKTTMKEIKEFIEKQHIAQVHSTTKNKKKRGYIVSFFPFERFQADLIDMSRYGPHNNGYNWIFLFIDIFTRKIYAWAMKKKTADDIDEVLREFLKKHVPETLTTDNESGFMDKKTQKILDEKSINHNTAEIGDHKALGVIDRAVKTIKMSITKYIEAEKTKKWKDKLGEIIEAYNDTPHDGIDGIPPNEATKPENKDTIQIMNTKKENENNLNKMKGIIFKIGDTVRIKQVKTKLTRAYDKKYSHEIFTIEKLNGQKATLNNNKIIDIRMLMKVKQNEEEKNDEKKAVDVIKEAKDEHRQRKILRAEDIKPENINKNRRKKTPKQFYGS